MKLYKNIIKAFGGAALYVDKNMLKCLDIEVDDEVCIELQPQKIIITKSIMSDKAIKEFFNAKAKIAE